MGDPLTFTHASVAGDHAGHSRQFLPVVRELKRSVLNLGIQGFETDLDIRARETKNASEKIRRTVSETMC